MVECSTFMYNQGEPWQNVVEPWYGLVESSIDLFVGVWQFWHDTGKQFDGDLVGNVAPLHITFHCYSW